MPVDPMFWLATAAFAWGLSLASYRWFATYNGWPMGEWQAHRPGLPIAIGLLAMIFSVFFAIARGGETLLILPLFGVVCAFAWTALLRVGAQSALLLAPISVIALLAIWTTEASRLAYPVAGQSQQPYQRFESDQRPMRLQPSAATERDGDTYDRDRGITRTK